MTDINLMDSQFQFKWNQQQTVIQNFTEWYTLNSEERSAYQEAPLSRAEAIDIFEKMYNVSVDSK